MESMNTKITVAVVGLLPNKTRHIESRCSRVKLKFVSGEHSETSIPQAHYVVLMTKFSAHRWEEYAFRYFGRDRVHKCRGGLSQLIDHINQLAG